MKIKVNVDVEKIEWAVIAVILVTSSTASIYFSKYCTGILRYTGFLGVIGIVAGIVIAVRLIFKN